MQELHSDADLEIPFLEEKYEYNRQLSFKRTVSQQACKTNEAEGQMAGPTRRRWKQGLILCVMDGPCRLPLPYRTSCPGSSCPAASWWHFQLLLYRKCTQPWTNYLYRHTKAKCRHLKNLNCKGTLRQVFIRELIDWRYSQSCWYFRPALWTAAPLPFSPVQVSPLQIPIYQVRWVESTNCFGFGRKVAKQEFFFICFIISWSINTFFAV